MFYFSFLWSSNDHLCVSLIIKKKPKKLALKYPPTKNKNKRKAGLLHLHCVGEFRKIIKFPFLFINKGLNWTPPSQTESPSKVKNYDLSTLLSFEIRFSKTKNNAKNAFVNEWTLV